MLGDVIFILCLAGWSAIVGRAILTLLRALPTHPVDSLSLCVPLGLGVLALAALGLGEVGHLDRTGFSVVFAVGLGISSIIVALELRNHARSWRLEFPVFRSPIDAGFAVSLIVALIGTFFTSLMPVTDGDALCYHLQVPKRFLMERAMLFDPDLHETIYPLLTEMLYAVALAFRGPVACRLLQWILGLCLAANVTAIARPILGSRAWWAGTIALLVPAVSNGMSAPLNDVSLAAFGNATLLAVLMWRDRPTMGRVISAGIFAGLAIGVKYPALIWVGILGLLFLTTRSNALRRLDSADSERRGASQTAFPRRAWERVEIGVLCSLGLFTSTALFIGGAWYLRAHIHTGNPVYPFFRHVFGGSGIDDVLDPIKRPLAVTPWNLLTALGPMTLDPDRFDSISHQFGPAFLLFVPGLFLLRPPKRIVILAAVGFAFLTICLTQRQSMRFLLVIVGPFSVAVAWIASEWWNRGTRPARLLVGLLVLIAGFESSIALFRIRHGLSVVSGCESSEAFLHRREPTFRVGRWIDANLAADARIIGQEHRGFYLPRDYVMELAHRRRTGLGTCGENPDQVIEQLRREGFTHLMTCPPDPITAVEFDGLLSRKLEPWLTSRTPLYAETITDPDGVTRRYRIDELETKLAMKARMR